MGEVLLIAAMWLCLINAVSFGLFAFDKWQAKRVGARRVSEATLINTALLGGGLGAKLAQQRLRHKGYKQPFGWQLNLAIGLSCVLGLALVGLATVPI